MDKSGLTEPMKKQLNETLGRAVEFEQLIHMPAWKRIQDYYANKVQQFTNDVILSDKPMESFRDERSEIKGIRGLLNSINNDLKELENERQAPRLTDE